MGTVDEGIGNMSIEQPEVSAGATRCAVKCGQCCKKTGIIAISCILGDACKRVRALFGWAV
jgi:hypothetical protein